MKSGLYIIKCAANGKCYIGQSVSVAKRIEDHKLKLRTNKHHNCLLQRAYNKYGDFHFEILSFSSVGLLDSMEKAYINQFDSVRNGFNMEYGGNSNKIISDQAKAKMSAAKAGRPSLRKGCKASASQRLKMSLAHKGKPSTRRGIPTNRSSWNKGMTGVQVSSRRIAVNVFNRQKEFIARFDSIQSFSDSMKITTKNRRNEDDGFWLGGYFLRREQDFQLAKI